MEKILSTNLEALWPYYWKVLCKLSEGKKHQSHPSVSLTNYNDDLPGQKYVYWCNFGTNIIGITSYFLIGIKAYSMRWNS